MSGHGGPFLQSISLVESQHEDGASVLLLQADTWTDRGPRHATTIMLTAGDATALLASLASWLADLATCPNATTHRKAAAPVSPGAHPIACLCRTCCLRREPASGGTGLVDERDA